MVYKQKYISGLKAGEPVDEVFLVRTKELRKTKKGNDYLYLELVDRTGQIIANIWDNTETIAPNFSKDDFVQVAGVVEEYKGKPQVRIDSLKRLAEGEVDLSDFIAQTGQDIDLLWAQVKEASETIKDSYLKQLIDLFLKDGNLAEAFKKSPASIKHHQPYLGGLLEHTVTMLNLARGILPSYPRLDRDLLIVGIILHDIGKIREYSFHLKPDHTDEGRLVGHTAIGLLMLDEKVRMIEGFPPELLMKLQHLVLSHHGERAFGAPVVPMTAEALVLHYLDNLDARLAEYYEQIDNITEANGKWTKWLESLERRFYKD